MCAGGCIRVYDGDFIVKAGLVSMKKWLKGVYAVGMALYLLPTAAVGYVFFRTIQFGFSKRFRAGQNGRCNRLALGQHSGFSVRTFFMVYGRTGNAVF